MYQFHIANHQRAIQYLNGDMKKSPFFDQHIRELNLEKLLLRPIQRLVQYELFMTKLEGETDEEHHDYDYIKQAMAATKKTIGDVNMAIKEIDQRTSIFSLEKRFIGKPALCAPHRQLMAEHEVEKWCVNLNRWKGYTLFLFNDLLIYARKKFRGYKLHQKIPIDEFCTCTYEENIIEILNEKIRKRPFKFKGKNSGVVKMLADQIQVLTSRFEKCQTPVLQTDHWNAFYDLLFSSDLLTVMRRHRHVIVAKYPNPILLSKANPEDLLKELKEDKALVIQLIKQCRELCGDEKRLSMIDMRTASSRSQGGAQIPLFPHG